MALITFLLNLSRPKIVLIIFKHLVFTQRKHNVQSLLGCLLTLFKEIIAVFSEKNFKPMNIFCGQSAELFVVKGGGTYSYHYALKV
jgi:hypothetical protein